MELHVENKPTSTAKTIQWEEKDLLTKKERNSAIESVILLVF